MGSVPQRIRLRSLAFLSLIFTLPSARSGVLSWETKTKEVTPAPKQQKLPVLFKFTNTAKYNVDIIAVEPPCTCMTAQFNKLRYKPGESGEIKIILNTGAKSGRQKEIVKVPTNSDKKPDSLWWSLICLKQ